MSGLSGIGVFWAFASFLASVLSCVGYFMPYWLTGEMTLHHLGTSMQTVPVHFGIFRRCNYPAIGNDGKLTMIHECGRYTKFHDIPSISWKIATLIVGLGCGVCLLVAFTAMFAVCVRGIVIPTVARTSGILQMCSGLLMAAGVGIYPNGLDSPEVNQACGFTSSAYHLGSCSLSWCFYMTSVGIGITLICSALSYHAPKRKQVVTGYAL